MAQWLLHLDEHPMSTIPQLDVRPPVAEAIRKGRAVVALESTLIAHGLPWPLNLETAQAAEQAVRNEGAVPATIAVWYGRPTVGLTEAELKELAQSDDVLKASRRDLGAAMMQKRCAATTVAGTMHLAHLAGIRLFATGGIGGVHRESHQWDISADLVELARIPVAVVCAGVKSVLDIPRTLEYLETHGVPVVGYRTDDLPAFYLRTSGEPVTCRVENAEDASVLLHAHWSMQGAGVILAQPVGDQVALEPDEFMSALTTAEREAVGFGVRGKELTPFLLQRLTDITQGQSLRANHALVLENARLAAQVAKAYANSR